MISIENLERACIKYDTKGRNDYTRDSMIIALSAVVREIVYVLNKLEADYNKGKN